MRRNNTLLVSCTAPAGGRPYSLVRHPRWAGGITATRGRPGDTQPLGTAPAPGDLDSPGARLVGRRNPGRLWPARSCPDRGLNEKGRRCQGLWPFPLARVCALHPHEAAPRRLCDAPSHHRGTYPLVACPALAAACGPSHIREGLRRSTNRQIGWAAPGGQSSARLGQGGKELH